MTEVKLYATYTDRGSVKLYKSHLERREIIRKRTFLFYSKRIQENLLKKTGKIQTSGITVDQWMRTTGKPHVNCSKHNGNRT